MLHLGSGHVLLRAHVRVQQQAQQWVKTWGWLDWFINLHLSLRYVRIFFDAINFQSHGRIENALREAQRYIQPGKTSNGPP